MKSDPPTPKIIFYPTIPNITGPDARKKELTFLPGPNTSNKIAEIPGLADLQERFKEISVLAKKVWEEIYRLLTEEFGYFL